MKRRPMLPAIYNQVNGFNAQGSVQYMAHLIDQQGNAYHLGGSESSTSGGIASHHPDQTYWDDKATRLRTVLTSANGLISRIEIDCTLLPCTGLGGCLTTVPALIRGLFNGLKTGQNALALLANVNPNKIPLRVFSHRSENPSVSPRGKVFFCTLGDSITQLSAAHSVHEEWLWVDYNNAYLGPNITAGGRTFAAVPNLT